LDSSQQERITNIEEKLIEVADKKDEMRALVEEYTNERWQNVK
jgi:hypothetical protein